MTAVARVDRAQANFDALKAYKAEGERRGIPAVIREIWAERQWLDLGYGSYGQACAAILGEEWRNPWPVEERREVVAELRAEGMSTRNIASAIGASHMTVQRDLESGGTPVTPARVVGEDGKSYAPSRPATVTTTTTETTEIVDLATGEILGEEVAAEVWEAEQGPTVDDVLAADPDVRAANLRKRATALLHELLSPQPDPAELLAIDAALVSDLADRLADLADHYRAVLPRRLSVVKES